MIMDSVINAIKKLGFREMIDGNGNTIQSYDEKRYLLANEKGHIYEIVRRGISSSSSNDYPQLSVPIEARNSVNYPCHQVMMWTFIGPPEQFFIDKKIYLKAGISQEEWNKCPQTIKDAYIKEYAEGKVIDHINADKADYSADNLQYLSIRENSKKSNK